jgi:hypothetical protein
MNLIPSAWLIFLIHFRIALCPRSILVVMRSAPWAQQFSSPVGSPTEEAGKNADNGFMRLSPVYHYRKQWVAKGKISIFVVKVNFLKS